MNNQNGWTRSLKMGLVIVLLAVAQSNLSVYNLQALGETNAQLLNIPFSIANFGFAPYGKTIIARLMHSPNFSDECVIDPNESANYQNSFLLIPRGHCEFVTKAQNAQKLGAQMAIIMDDKQHEQMVLMADNGYGYKVKIPTIFINHQNGQLLKKLLEDNEDSSVMMKITFDNHKTEKVDVTFWLQGNNRHSYKLVEDFRKFYPLIKDNINFALVYSTVNCPSCQEFDCYFNKTYCAINLIHEESANGKLILDQQIREEITHEKYPDLWWKYMKFIGDECGVISELKECGEKAMKKYEMNPAVVEEAFKASFTADKDNKWLKKNSGILANAGIIRYPTVTLNGVKVKASLNAEFIFDDICNTLINAPKDCQKYVTSETKIQEHVTNEWSTLILVIIIGLLIFSVIFCLYRRYMKKKISFEMQSRVDDMVSKYIEFYSERNGKK